MNRQIKSRRSILTLLAAAIASACTSRNSGATGLTPTAAEGPFYPIGSMRKADVDNDLVKVAGLVEEAGGEVIILSGMVTDNNGAPQEGMRVEIWQCDLNGKYLHPGDNRSVDYDHGFQGFGHDITGPDGRYSFRTIKPGKYPGRTPHIHVKVFNETQEVLTTQFYEDNPSENSNDSLYRRLSAEQANSVVMNYRTTEVGEETTVNIIV